jgi:hypothetical protein
VTVAMLLRQQSAVAAGIAVETYRETLRAKWLTVSYYLYNLRTAALRLIVRSGLDVPTFATRRLHACHYARAPSGGRWNCGREMSPNFA